MQCPAHSQEGVDEVVGLMVMRVVVGLMVGGRVEVLPMVRVAPMLAQAPERQISCPSQSFSVSQGSPEVVSMLVLSSGLNGLVKHAYQDSGRSIHKLFRHPRHFPSHSPNHHRNRPHHPHPTDERLPRAQGPALRWHGGSMRRLREDMSTSSQGL